MIKKWFQYTVECSDGSYYAGITTDLRRRVDEHNTTKKAAKYTRCRRPVRLVYFIECENRSSALKAEVAFKKLSRKEKQVLVSERLLRLMQ